MAKGKRDCRGQSEKYLSFRVEHKEKRARIVERGISKRKINKKCDGRVDEARG